MGDPAAAAIRTARHEPPVSAKLTVFSSGGRNSSAGKGNRSDARDRGPLAEAVQCEILLTCSRGTPQTSSLSGPA